MAARPDMDQARPGDTLLVIHEFTARSPDELSLKRGDRIELIERDDDFGDGWFLGRHLLNGLTGLFPEVYTQLAPRPTFSSVLHSRPSVTYTASPTSINGPSFANPEGAAPPDDDQPLPAPALSEAPAPQTASATVKRSATAPMALSAVATMNNGQRVLSGEQRSPVMNETLSVIDEHLTDINTPRGSMTMRQNDSSSEYSSHVEHRLSYINGQETDEEEQGLHTLEEIRHWSPLQVAEWLEDVGVDRRQCEVFKEQEISGEVLLGMDQASVFMKEFDLGPIGPRLKIWQKIKALQQEVAEAVRSSHSVQDYSGSEHGSSTAGSIRHRSTSIGTVLPRIPSLMESNGGRPSSRQQLNRTSSQQQGSAPGTPGSTRNDVRRPSAASVREMNQHRRHSSIEFANVPTTPTTPSNVQVTQATPTGHKKAPSFDRDWKMGDAAANGRPASSAQMRPLSPGLEDSPGGGLKVVTPDLDRGYFSGGEVENRKQRNVLRKGHSPSHSRTSSSGNDGRRLSAFKRHSRFGSSDSIRDREFSEPSIFSSAFYSPTKRTQSARTASGPELRSSPKAVNKERSQTVTKLDYGAPSIDAIASSPHLAEGEDASGRASPPPAIQRYPKQRATGLRAISDALAGTLSGTKNPPVSPNKDSPMNSPVRTGSSTPSHTSKSFDSGEAPPDVLRSATGNSMAPTTTSSAPKKKTKKETSAYQRGLENKPPSETIPGSDYSGWMKKRSSNMMTTWKTRLFVLKGRRLSYYYSEFDTAEKGLIDISGHRVLPANNERITGLHATITGAKSSPTSPHNATLTTSAQTDAANEVDVKDDTSGMFIFKLVPPRSGLSKAVNFTKPTVHYFAVDNLQQGRLWMAALMKATIDRDESKEVISTYQQKTISLAKARAMQQRPPALMGDDEDEENVNPNKIDEEDEVGLAISGLEDEKKADGDTVDESKRSGSIGTSEAASSAVTASVEGGDAS
ncbi:polarized growth protein Boi2 [Macrophomina phaseolina]|uniref:Polarized growth protein Boi2 n=1 Tax=Macrophomina phaseolina TaxID=35725 RepID=A0ABQ8GWY8_9PEZI|nr:polarized growth protein Boi2 [Macrophomina phaseolina]